MREAVSGVQRSTEELRKRVGTILKAKWHLDKLLGFGAMAAVYKATHRNGNEVAIKILHPDVSIIADVRARFVREGYVANKVKHRGALRVLDDDVADGGSAFLVMELLEGETLASRAKRKGGRLVPDEVLAVMDQLLDTLIVAHEQGVVHRDIKPDNLFLCFDGTLKVLDFGIARLWELSQSGSTTQTGSVLGTPAFMSPEQARGRWEEVDARTDLWAVAACMFTSITGQFVHVAETRNEMLALAAVKRARSIAVAAPGLHPAVIELVDKALAYDKQDRFPDAKSMQTALRQTCQSAFGHGVGPLPTPSIQGTQGGDTVTLPAEQNPANTGITKPFPSELVAQDAPLPDADDTGQTQAVTTARGVAAPVALPDWVAGGRPPAARSKLPMVVGAAAALLIATAVAAMVFRSSIDTTDSAASSGPATEAASAAEPAVQPEMADSVETDSPIEQLEESEPDAGSFVATTAARPKSPPGAATPTTRSISPPAPLPKSVPTTTSSAKSARPKATSTASAAVPDPFDLRR